MKIKNTMPTSIRSVKKRKRDGMGNMAHGKRRVRKSCQI